MIFFSPKFHGLILVVNKLVGMINWHVCKMYNVHDSPLKEGRGSKLDHVVVECPLPQWIHSPAIKSSTSALSSSFLDCNCNVLESSAHELEDCYWDFVYSANIITYTVLPHIVRPSVIILLHSLQMRVLLENTTFL